jgi:DNA-binding IclR family transcriptional regulator
MSQQGSKTVTSKVMAILAAFDCTESTLTLTRIAEVAGLTMPTAHRLVGELVEGGALKKDGRGRYRVGRLIGKVGDNAGPEVRASGRSYLVEVIRLTGEACHFALRDGDQALIRDRLYGPEQSHRARKLGDRLPLHLTAVGLALLAFDDEGDQQAYLGQMVDGEPKFTALEQRRLRAQLGEVRERRYATLMSEPHSGPASLAVPVLIGDCAVAAIGLIMTATHPRQLMHHTAALLEVAKRMEPEARRWVHYSAVRDALARGR